MALVLQATVSAPLSAIGTTAPRRREREARGRCCPGAEVSSAAMAVAETAPAS
jgi:hypothetical protein